MQSITFKTQDALRSITENPDKFLELAMQKGKKEYQNIYLDAKIKVGPATSRGLWLYGSSKDKSKDKDGNEIVIDNGIHIIANLPNKEAAKEKFKTDSDKQRMRIATSLSRSGSLGTFLKAYGPVFEKEVRRLDTEKKLEIGKCDIQGFLQTEVSKKSKNVETRGQAIEDPIGRIVVDLGAPKDHIRKKYAWGKTVTQFFDYNKSYQDENGATKYREVTVMNADGVEEPVNEDNVHKVVTAGSYLHEWTIFFSSPCQSQGYISSKPYMTNCVIEIAPEIDDSVAEIDFGDSAPVKVNTNTVVTADTAVTADAATAVVAAENPGDANAMDIDNCLDEL